MSKRQYNGLLFTPMSEPPIPKSTPYAPQPPYVGDELARLTSMTPFDGGQFSPVYMQRPYKDMDVRRIWGGYPPPSQFFHGPGSYNRTHYAGTWNSSAPGRGIDAQGVTIKGKNYLLQEGPYGRPAGMKLSDPALPEWKEIVKALQTKLIALGHLAPTYGAGKTNVDGLFQRATTEAVKAFQAERGLSPTGIVDANTAMFLYPPTTQEQAAAKEEQKKAEEKKKSEERASWLGLDFDWGNFLGNFSKPRVQPLDTTIRGVNQTESNFPWGPAVFGTVAVVGLFVALAYVKKGD